MRKTDEPITCCVAASSLAMFGARHLLWAAAVEPARSAERGSVLTGADFNLEIGSMVANFTGTPRGSLAQLQIRHSLLVRVPTIFSSFRACGFGSNVCHNSNISL